MRSRFLLLVFVISFAVDGICQTPPPDSDPLLRGKLSYTMQQAEIDAGLYGHAVVAVRVDETGKPIQAIMVVGPSWPCSRTPVKTLEHLGSTLSDLMLKMRFSPAIQNGQPVSKDITIRITLDKPSPPDSNAGNDKAGLGKIEPKSDGTKSAAEKTDTKIVRDGVVNGKAVSLPVPKYPKEAQANGDSGPVSILVLIDEKGKVISAGAVNGLPSLQIAARSAACDAKFAPTTLSGVPVKVSGVITYNFTR